MIDAVKKYSGVDFREVHSLEEARALYPSVQLAEAGAVIDL